MKWLTHPLFLSLWISVIIYTPITHAEKQFHFQAVNMDDGASTRSSYQIAEDDLGFIWFATNNGLLRYDGYEMVRFTADDTDPTSIPSNLVLNIHLDHENNFWVVTNKGLSLHSEAGFQPFTHNPLIENSIGSDVIRALESSKTGLWVGTDEGLDFLPYGEGEFIHFDLPNDFTLPNKIGHDESNLIHSILINGESEIMIATNSTVYRLDLNSKKYARVDTPMQPKKNTVYRHLTMDGDGRVWQGTQDNLFLYDEDTKLFQPYSSVFDGIPILKVLPDEDGIWIATWKNGLFLITPDDEIQQFTQTAENSKSLPGMTIHGLFKDSSGMKWLRTRGGDTGHFTLKDNFFGVKQNSVNLFCYQSPSITSFFPLNDSQLLLGTKGGLYRYDIDSKQCTRLLPTESGSAEYINYAVNSISRLNQDKVAISSARGVSVLDTKTGIINEYQKAINAATFFFIPVKENLYLQGTSIGLYLFDDENKTHAPISVKPELGTLAVYSVEVTNEGQYIFGTSKGLATLAKDNTVKLLFTDGDDNLNRPVYSMYVDQYIWLGSKLGKVFQYNFQGKLIGTHTLSQENQRLHIASLLTDNDGNLWVGTQIGLFRVDIKNRQVRHFIKSDGLQNNAFNLNSAFKANDGQLYFGGSNGFNSFHPTNIPTQSVPPTVTFTKLRRFNKDIEPGENDDGFSISNSIERLNTLELRHSDSLIRIEFSALDFADPNRNKYAYLVEGLHTQWILTNANNRWVTLSSLTPGTYYVKVKAANKDGVWSTDEKSAKLTVVVRPAPWATWWAYTLYSLLFALSVWGLIRYRTAIAREQATKLEIQVDERTKEINAQKTTIEFMLERKDQLLANISHEFRTPLTLILGPLEHEISSAVSPKNLDNLEMVRRNAHRLLSMVEQILMLADIKNEQPQKKIPLSVTPIMKMIIESFQPLAQSKNINLAFASQTQSTPNCFRVLVSPDALEVMVGNIMSNAIKYTPRGGRVLLSVTEFHTSIKIVITDNGVGIPKEHKDDIFERFTRLDKTSDINGTGIGLSIVKELVESHTGEISIESEEGVGSVFTITLPSTNLMPTNNPTAKRTIRHLTTHNPVDQEQITSVVATQIDSLAHNEELASLLIIDDSLDMHAYIKSAIDEEYNWSVANRGEAGISLAIRDIPDLIICDVMMPGINGYEVVRKLRGNQITSHIPIIMLTAKGDKESRIQGWNENIDDYMSKPFDALELRSRIANILSIRRILKRNASHHIQVSQLKPIPSITLQEQNFLNKLNRVLDKNHSSPSFSVAKMASEMAVSERQLQRKLKSIVDLTPLDYLRNHRLEKSVIFLREGKKITTLSYDCGFVAPSHFARCFKAKYGITPKQYQKGKIQGAYISETPN